MGTIQEYFVESTAPSTLSERFQHFYANGELLDTTLVCKNGSIRAHKVVIAALSKFFEDIIIQNPCKNPVIVMLDMEIDTLKCLVDYMYYSKVTLKSSMLDNFIKAANILGLNSMIQAVEEEIKDENAQELMENVDEYTEAEQEGTEIEHEQEGHLVQVQTLGSQGEESFTVEEADEQTLNHQQLEEVSPSRTIFVSNRHNFESKLMNQRARTRIISRKRRFDVVALRQKSSENTSQIMIRKDVIPRIESGLISVNQQETIESLDDTVGTHFKIETDANGIKVHQCLLCPHTSSFPSNMKRHIMGHLGIKPYKCGYCDFQSTLRGDLNVHLKKKHPDARGSQGIIILK